MGRPCRNRKVLRITDVRLTYLSRIFLHHVHIHINLLKYTRHRLIIIRLTCSVMHFTSVIQTNCNNVHTIKRVFPIRYVYIVRY